MKPLQKPTRKKTASRRSFLLAVCAGIALMHYGVFEHIDLFARIERISLDLRFRLRPAVAVSERLGTIDIDEKTIRQAGTWPISRRYYADFMHVLHAYDASLMIFDIFFPDTGPMDIDLESMAAAAEIAAAGVTENDLPRVETILRQLARRPDDDLRAAMAATDITVLAQTFSLANIGLFPDLQPSGRGGVDLRIIDERTAAEREAMPPHHRTAIRLAERFSIPAPPPDGAWRNIARAYRVEPPHPMFLERATGLGFAQIIEDSDGVVRNYPLMIQYDGRLYPSTVLAGLCLLRGIPLDAVHVDPGRRMILPPSNGRLEKPVVIPVDKKLRMTTNWTGDYLDTFLHFPGTLILRYRAEQIIRERIQAYGDNWRDLIAAGVRPLAEAAAERNLAPVEDARLMAQTLFLARLAELSDVIGIPSRDAFVQALGSGDKPELRATLPEIWDQVKANHHLADMLRENPSMTYEAAQALRAPRTAEHPARRHAFDHLTFFLKRGQDLSAWRPLYFFPPENMRTGPGHEIRRISPLDLADKILFVGLTATGTHDIKPMPYSAYYPMVGLHANAMNTILTGRYIREPPVYAKLFLVLVFALGAWLVIPNTRPYPAALFTIGAAAAYFLAAKTAFDRAGLALPLLAPILALAANYLSITVFRYVNERKERRRTRTVFSTYLSPAVVDMVLREPDLLHLGGRRREMSVYFSDLSGFTSMSEDLSPEELVTLMNQYFEAMTRILLKYNGTLDKYIGDSIMAFWNAPSEQTDHAILACLAAMECRDHLVKGLHPRWRKEGKPLLAMRAGVNTGPMIVGNMGSDTRMNYTVMGDAVNLGARLESANKEYGTTIMISEFTREKVRRAVVCRELDLLRVIGKSRPIKVYDVMVPADAESATERFVLETHHQGLAAYRNRDWRKAIECFTEILRRSPADGPAQTFLERCRRFLAAPPPADWDGVWTLKGK